MKQITLNNYYDKLTQKQKKKFREKKGMLCYYEWFETLVDDCTPEEIGYIFLGLLHYDRFGGSVELPDFIIVLLGFTSAAAFAAIRLFCSVAMAANDLGRI